MSDFPRLVAISESSLEDRDGAARRDVDSQSLKALKRCEVMLVRGELRENCVQQITRELNQYLLNMLDYANLMPR